MLSLAMVRRCSVIQRTSLSISALRYIAHPTARNNFEIALAAECLCCNHQKYAVGFSPASAQLALLKNVARRASRSCSLSHLSLHLSYSSCLSHPCFIRRICCANAERSSLSSSLNFLASRLLVSIVIPLTLPGSVSIKTPVLPAPR